MWVVVKWAEEEGMENENPTAFYVQGLALYPRKGFQSSSEGSCCNERKALTQTENGTAYSYDTSTKMSALD